MGQVVRKCGRKRVFRPSGYFHTVNVQILDYETGFQIALEVQEGEAQRPLPESNSVSSEFACALYDPPASVIE